MSRRNNVRTPHMSALELIGVDFGGGPADAEGHKLPLDPHIASGTMTVVLRRHGPVKTYTVKQLSKLSGVSIRALHYYDQIGLLKPAFLGENRYRYYGLDEMLRLQQIIIHRELGLSLGEIASVLDRPDFDRLEALIEQKKRLEREAARFATTISAWVIEHLGARPEPDTRLRAILRAGRL